MSIVDRIAAIEAEMARTQKNKATSGHLGLLKAKLAKLKRELLEPKGGGGGGGGGGGFEVKKTGLCSIGTVGFPSVGKSTLMSKITNTYSEVAAYEFTTLVATPGSFTYNGAKLQLVDLPGIIEGAVDGKGRGRQVIATAKEMDLILIVLDALKPLTHKHKIERELEGFGIRLNCKPPPITFRKKDKGGVAFIAKGIELTHLDADLVKSILAEYRIQHADVELVEDSTVDELIDVIELSLNKFSRTYVPALYVLNKIDQITIEELDILDRMPNYVPVSAFHEWNFDGLLEKIWEKLNLVRIYTKPKGQIPDYQAPVCLPANRCKVEDFVKSIHKTLLQQFKYANVWGSSVKHTPQKCGLAHVLHDEDVVQIVKK